VVRAVGVRVAVREVEGTVEQEMAAETVETSTEVEMSAEVKKRISERLWVNGSIVISDHGLGNETGKGTDFIVLTK
jgi:hypothetical protein